MKWTMAFAVKLIDQFTSIPITDKGIWIRDSIGKPLFRKEDGWFVLMDNGENIRTVFMDVPGYEPEKVTVDCKTINQRREACFYQYLIPAMGYVWPSQISFWEENGGPGTARWSFWPETEGVLRLLKAYDPETDPWRLTLKLPKGFPVRDRRILIRNEEKEAEVCSILDEEDSVCTLEYPLKHSYLPKETRISLLYRTVFDSAGVSKIPVLLETR